MRILNAEKSDVSQDGRKECNKNVEASKISCLSEEFKEPSSHRRSEESQSIRNDRKEDVQESRKSDFEFRMGLRESRKKESSCERIKKNPSQSELIELFEKVYPSGVPNFRGCRILLPQNKMNIPLWRHWLEDYGDKIVCEFLEFGFPYRL